MGCGCGYSGGRGGNKWALIIAIIILLFILFEDENASSFY